MELHQLKYFYVIAQCESLTKAARKLHISQPSLSRCLHSLESELGTPLFDRVGRNIVLNETGRFVLDKAIGVINSVNDIKQETEKFIHDENLSVDLYTPVPMGDVESIIIGFKQQYPDIRLRIASWHSESLKNVRPTITFFASPIVHNEPNYLLLGEEDIIVAASNRNPLSDLDSVNLADLSHQKFISVLSDSPFYSIATHMFLQAGFKPHIVAEDKDSNRLMAYVANDFGIAIAPRITWFGKWNKSVSAIPINDVKRKRYLYLKWPEDGIMNWATLRFRDYIIDHFNSEYGFTCSCKTQSNTQAKVFYGKQITD